VYDIDPLHLKVIPYLERMLGRFHIT